MQLPPHLQPVYSGVQIDDAVNRMGRAISPWAKSVWESSHADLLTIPVLRGGIFFFADLVRQIDSSVEIAPTRIWAYEDNTVERDRLALSLEDVPAKGRSVLIIDDICDSGRTLDQMAKELLNRGALEVKSAVMIYRKVAEPKATPDWFGFEYDGPEWLVGYGMDDANRFRNLHQICAITTESK